MQKIAVVGVGPGAPHILTPQAAQALSGADQVFCAPRHRGLAAAKARLYPLSPLPQALSNMAKCRREGGRAAVLVSGDPGLFSLLNRLRAHFGGDALEVMPGVGALPFFAARLGESWQGAAILSGHGRPLSQGELVHAARRGRQTYVFLDETRSAQWLADTLAAWGLNHVRLAVGERLSYPDERIAEDAPSRIAQMAFGPLCLARIYNPAPETGPLAPGLPDSAFVRGSTPMTKQAVRALALAALELTQDALVWDVGAGTGSVSVECARQCPGGQVYAIEKSQEGASLIWANARQFLLPNLRLVHGCAPEALQGLPAPSHVFIGGSGGRMEAILAHLLSMPQSIRLAATAVTLESAGALMALGKDLARAQMQQVSVTPLEAAGSLHMFRAQNPVFLFSATKEATP